MADFGDFTEFIPDLSGMGSIFIIILIATIVCAGIGFLVYWFVIRKRYNKIIRVFRKVGQRVTPVFIDKGMFERVGIAGDHWLYCKKTKKILPRPRIQMDKNEFWFYERDDGEWINFSLSDFDDEMKKAGIYYLDEDMRLNRIGIERNLRDRHLKKSFWGKYGAIIMTILFIVVVTVCLVILFKELAGLTNALNGAMDKVGKMADAVNNMATRIGSGTVPK